ncbi:MAG: response regulator [Lachnospiraceae bacterium]|nr:response regulator [Lachnospiraceae bacterium]
MKKILIVDDCIDYAYSLQKLLQHRGYDTDTAASLTEAKEKIDKERYLLICSDLDLQDGSALELLDAVKVSELQIPFLVMSCHEMDDWESEAVQRGATFCLDKIKIEQVKDKVLEYACRE